jgi:alcohol dehydrogenase class IV
MTLEQLSGIGRIVRGPGSAAILADWLREHRRVALVTGAGLETRGGAPANLARGVFGAVRLTLGGEPSDLWVDEVRARLCGQPVDAVVSLGGGSVLDAGKALAALLCEDGPAIDFLEGVGTRKPSGRSLPWFALPTTAGTGSEASTNAVLSRPGPGGFKRSLRHPAYRAAGVVLDAELCQGAPSALTAACGMDAFTQMLESFLSTRVPIELEPVLEAALVRAYHALPRLVHGENTADRQTMLEAAFLSGVGLTRAGLGTVHGLAGPAGACAKVPHGIACARFFGPSLRETRRWLAENPHPPTLEKLRRLAASGVDFDALERWADDFGLPFLRGHGLGEAEQNAILAAASDRDSPARLGPEVWARVLREAVG